MLVIGFNSKNNTHFSHDLDIDPNNDSPREIHDLLSKKAKGTTFSKIVCVEDAEEIASFEDGEDFDLAEEVPDDADDEEADPDSIQDED